MESTRRMRLIAACGLFLFALVVYLPSLSCGFVDYDDLDYLHTNVLVVQPGWHTITTPGPASHADYLPVTMSLYALQWALFGPAPLPFHLANVLLHACATVLLFFLLLKLLPDLPLGLAVAAAALFAAHPMNTEAVTWISETKSVLCMGFALAGFLAWVRWREGGSAAAWIGSLVLHGLSLGAKTASVTFPLAYLLSDLWLRRKTPLSRAVVPLLPHLALSGVALVVRMQLQSATAQDTMLALFSGPVERVATVLDVFAWNILAFAGGVEQNAVHALHIARSLLEPSVIAGALLAAAAVAGSLLLARKRPGIAFGLMWFVVIGLPTSQIIPLPPVLRADRYLYFSGIGLLIALAAVAGELARRPRARHVAVALLLGTASLLAVSSARRQGVWTDSRTLWTDSVAKAPANDLSRRALGRVLLAGGDVEGALAQYRRALELDPELMVNLQDLGSALVLAGRMEEAIPLFEKSVARFPRSMKGWSSLGHCRLHGRGDAEGALACFVKVAELDPTDPEPLDQAAMCFTRLGRRDVARAWRERAEQLRQARAAPAR